MRYFDNFTEEEITRYDEFDFYVNGDCLYNDDLGVSVYKHDDKFYAERNEEEECFQEMDGRIYVLSPVWYMPVDLEKLCADYADGSVTADNFDIESYELY